jgi:hypothetical protein
MRLSDRVKDSMIVGVLLGLILIPVFYFLSEGLRALLVNFKQDNYVLRPPAVQLLTLLFSAIIFRVLMINWKKENTGKGFLLVIMVAVISYFFIYFRLRNQ